MKKIIIILPLVLLSLLLMANIPAPWWPCDGKQEGDPCVYGYGCNSGGRCRLVEQCRDNPETRVNECLHCRT